MSTSYFGAIGDKIKSFDIFGQTVGFEFAGRSSLNSYLGALLSLCITIVTLFYAVGRFKIMLDFGDTTYQQVTEKDVMIGETFKQEDTEFNVAFEVTTLYNYSPNIKIDHFGFIELNASIFTKNKGSPSVLQQLATHRCTVEDFKTKFNRNNGNGGRIEKWFDGQMLCLDEPELLTLRG